MGVWVVASCEDHARIWRHLQIELVENSLAFIYFTKLHIEIFCHIKGLYWLWIVPNVPNVHGEIVTREQVVIASWGKFRHSYRIYDFCEEVLAGWIFLKFNFHGVVVKLRTDAQIAEAYVAIAGGEKENVRPLWVIVHMCDDFGELLDVGRLQVHHLIGLVRVLQIPQVDAQVIWGKEIFTVWAHT